MDNYLINCISYIDFYNGYLNLMYEFSNFEKNDITYDYFKKYIDERETKKILVIHHNNIVIGAGTIFKLEKIHNNPIGQIEDVIISKDYRNLGLGKLLIKKLIDIGIYEFKCYKITLNCLDKNIEFYKKLKFHIAGVQLKLLS